MNTIPSAIRRSAPWAALLVLTAGCATPFEDDNTSADRLRSAVVAGVARDIDLDPQSDRVYRTVERDAPDRAGLDFSDERLEELNMMAGLDAEGADEPPELAPDLLGDETLETVTMTLDEAVMTAIRNNLDVAVASFEPALSEQDLREAEAAFDFVFFAGGTWDSADEPSQRPSFGGASANVRETLTFDAGLRKLLTTGGTAELSTRYSYIDDNSRGVDIEPNPAHAADITASLRQPLLRGFGRSVTLAEVRLAANARIDSVEILRGELFQTILDTERAYWNLFAARERLTIQKRLLERGIGVRNTLKSRLDAQFDVRPAEYSDAVARVEQRRGDIISAENQLRRASDTLKLILNDPSLPIAGETLILPADRVTNTPITYSLLDAIDAAVANRPTVRRAALAVDARRIDRDVAENGLLPDLDLTLEAEFAGLDSDADDAYGEVFDSQFVSTLIGLAFERALGNNAEEARFTAARLRIASSLTSYQRAVRVVIDDVKASLRDVDTAYRLIEQSRTSRLAAAENLRTLLVEKELTRGLTADFLDLEFTRQELLAQAEIAEVQALTDYAIALAELDASTATALERRGIDVVVPTADELLDNDPLAPLVDEQNRPVIDP
jgi:outer membrane protein TolC